MRLMVILLTRHGVSIMVTTRLPKSLLLYWNRKNKFPRPGVKSDDGDDGDKKFGSEKDKDDFFL